MHTRCVPTAFHRRGSDGAKADLEPARARIINRRVFFRRLPQRFLDTGLRKPEIQSPRRAMQRAMKRAKVTGSTECGVSAGLFRLITRISRISRFLPLLPPSSVSFLSESANRPIARLSRG